MMVPTHILAGGTLGLVTSFFAPELVPVAVLAGMVGGFLPDIDMFFEHRKTFHRPFQYMVLTSILSVATFFQSGPILVFTTFVFASMTLHSFMEIFSNGKTMRPTKEKDDRAVYNHFTGTWVPPKRMVLDASRSDLLLTIVFAFPLFLTGTYFYTVLALFLSGVLYFLVADWLKQKMNQYDRFSEFFQHLLGFGPEVGR